MRTDVSGREWSATVAAAQAGDRRALEELLEGWLPLVYNVVGRALNGHADVDDVVQETMIRAVDNLGTLRDPDSFRSWLMAIAMRQIRDRARRGKGRRSAEGPPQDGDFAELSVLRLQLEGSGARSRRPCAGWTPRTGSCCRCGGWRWPGADPARAGGRRRHQQTARRRPRAADEGAPRDLPGHRPGPGRSLPRAARTDRPLARPARLGLA
ncbi:sigma-70 family RNA polymerase sigma factor [Streptomyces diastatochromogenes]|nr:sigma-70 family RNA polymerase sigma factor [Streptomyces diastatochromogenes]